jgi:hypothetical protein
MFGISIVPPRRCELTFRCRLASHYTWISSKINLEPQIYQDLLLRVISCSQSCEFWTRKQKKCRIFHFGVRMVAVSRIFIIFDSRNTLKNHCSTRVPIRRMRATTKYRDIDKSLARPGRKQATATEDFDVHISYI